jgi:hypothetical protein
MPSAGTAMTQAPHAPRLQARSLSVQYGGVLALGPLSFGVGARSLIDFGHR